jgi:hypothetical protein
MLYQILEHCRLSRCSRHPSLPFHLVFPCARLCMVDTFFKPAHLHYNISQFAKYRMEDWSLLLTLYFAPTSFGDPLLHLLS